MRHLSLALWANMPEAAMHKYREFTVRKVKVRRPRQLFTVLRPAVDAASLECVLHQPFCRAVTPTTNAPHQSRTLLLREWISSGFLYHRFRVWHIAQVIEHFRDLSDPEIETAANLDGILLHARTGLPDLASTPPESPPQTYH